MGTQSQLPNISGSKKTWLAKVSASLESAQYWFNFRDQSSAKLRYDQAFNSALTSPITADEAKHLDQTLPSSTTKILIKRTEKCFIRYEDVMKTDGEFLPQELDEATDAVRKCVCRELDRIRNLTGGFMPGGILERWWEWC